MMRKIPVGILGATGIVGQQYIHLLNQHPWFEVAFLAASEKSAGRTYEEAVSGRWHLKDPIPKEILNQHVYPISAIQAAQTQCHFVFSALDSEVAKIQEMIYASNELPVVSNASAHRNTADVPVLIPEINAEHLKILPIQQKNRGWKKGFIVVKPNCSLQAYLTPLYAVHSLFPVKRVLIATMQAISGAGHPGVSSLDIVDNVFPLPSEEDKSEKEPLKILGRIHDEMIELNPSIAFSAHCNRVPVLDGHYACVSFECQGHPPSESDILSLWKEFRSVPQTLDLPSAPKQPIFYRSEKDRPQTRLDRDIEKGMATVVGRLRPCNVMHYRFSGLSHNTIRGAAGGGILNAELLVAQGYL